ncbi:hypothetical protein KAR91_55255 [Candidatus Pacearchaeota archaeon]|nr:hypothetical protein [Candidatus Pacearchaeota archaeon]
MKIKDLTLKNFAKVSEVSVSFDKNITYLIGSNGSGKTTIGLNGVFFAMKGLAQKGDGIIAERFRFIGPHSKSAKAILTLYDEEEGFEAKISRKLLKNKTELKIEASDGRQLDQAWLSSIFNSFLIDPMGFSRLSGKAQALAFGADTASFDVKKKELELERRDIGRDVKRLQAVVDAAGNPEKAEMVDLSELLAELTKRQKIIITRNKAIDYLETLDGNIKDSLGDVEYLEQKLSAAKMKLVRDNDARHDKANEIQMMKTANEQEIKNQIENAQAVNLKATAYEKFQVDKGNLTGAGFDYDSKTLKIKENEADRTKYLKSLELPWPNITINDDGEFRLNDKPFCSSYFSAGELLKLGAKIGSKLKDGLKYVFFPNSEALDDKNREAVFKALNDDGFQIVAEVVGTEKKKATSILLKEMTVVESYDGAKENGLR